MEDKLASPPPDITALDEDALVHCASYLKMEDITNLSLTCKRLNCISSSDSIWLRWFQEHWPLLKLPASSVKAAYIRRLTELRKFKFCDPSTVEFQLRGRRIDHVLLDKDCIIFSQGTMIKTMKIDSLHKEVDCGHNLRGHNARITCIRLFPHNKGEDENKLCEKLMATSSADHCIRLWSRGSSQRCFRGHSGPVLTLSDKLFGDDSVKLLASGGEDATVRIWSLDSGRKSGQQALRATLYGHERPVKLLSIPGYKSSLLISMSMDSKVRVWDAITSSSVRYASCVGVTTVSGAPVDMMCHDALLYVAAGTSVVAIDLKTMQKAFTSAFLQSKICSFKMVPSKLSICTGGADGKTLLWDVRRSQSSHKPEPVAELDGHSGPVSFLHMDRFKVITGSPEDMSIHVWDADTGQKCNSFNCCNMEPTTRYSAIAAYGTQMVIACHDDDRSVLHYKNFFDSVSCARFQEDHPSKFWSCGTDADDDRE